jgi:elongation factor Ts
MAVISPQDIKRLREETQAGVMDCKRALEEAEGDFQKAKRLLYEQGMLHMEKRSDREASQGVIESYIHQGRIGAMVEVNCETDFVANTDAFKTFVKEVGLHIANLAPEYVRREEIPSAVVEAERDITRRRTVDESPNKPEAVIEKIVDGRMEKFFQEIVLMEQPWLKDDSKTISQLLSETVAEVGESILIRRFARFALGEGDNGVEGE